MRLLLITLILSLLNATGALADAALTSLSPKGLGIVVHDATQATQQYNRLLGINHWRIIDVELSNGRGGLRIARGDFKGTEIELIQPLHGRSAVSSFLKKRGQGIYHVSLGDQSVSIDAPVVDKTAAVHWHDTFATLGVNLKMQSSAYSAEQAWGTIELAPQSIPLGNARIAQLGIVVADALATAKEWRAMGIAPWVFVDFKPPMTSNGLYRGAKGTAFSHVLVGYGQWQTLQIELLQGVSGPTPHRDFFRSVGAGAHHLSLGRLENHDALQAFYQAQGLSLQMQSDNGGTGRTASYMGSEGELGWVLEFTRAFKGLGTLQIVNQLGPLNATHRGEK